MHYEIDFGRISTPFDSFPYGEFVFKLNPFELKGRPN